MNTLGSQIKRLRIKAKLKAEELAEKCGVSRATVFRWEKNGANPPFETLQQLSSVLGCEVVDLIGDGKTLQQVVAENPEVAKDLIPTEEQARMFQWLMYAIKEHPTHLASAIVAMPGAGQRYAEWQQRQEQENAKKAHVKPTRNYGVKGTPRQWIPGPEAEQLMVWVSARMKEISPMNPMWKPLQHLSEELGRLCAPEVPSVHEATPSSRGGSAEANESSGTGDVKPRDKSVDHSLSFSRRNMPK